MQEDLPPAPPICPSCGNPKTYSGTGKNAGWRCRPCSHLKSKTSGNLAKSQIKKRIKSYDAKTELMARNGSACNLCGYHKHQSALEFHHINPADKLFTISKKNRVTLTPEVEEEVNKCILVCSNCHRHLHTQNCESPEFQYNLLKLREKAIRRSKGWWSKVKRLFSFQ